MRLLLLAALVPFVPLTVHDGDTLKGRVELRPGLTEEVTVRLDCLNAPELRKDGGGVAETLRLRAWLAQDGGYTLRTTWAREKYGRLLGEPMRLLQDGGSIGFCSEVSR